MLSGDKSTVVKFVADKLGINNAFGDLLPEDKVNKVKEIKTKNETVAFVGDGVNDAPVVASVSYTHLDVYKRQIATLSQEQIKIVGIQLGTIEQKELTATIKANGNLKVPNNNKGNATSLYGGVIKMLNVQIGDYVKKGQVIATIANPQFIQLQEEYLSTASKISFAEQELARQKELNEGNAGAKKNLQSATAELNSLRTRRASLQQQIQLMGINPGSVSNSNLKSALVVTSPLNGTVSNVFAKIGSCLLYTSRCV